MIFDFFGGHAHTHDEPTTHSSNSVKPVAEFGDFEETNIDLESEKRQRKEESNSSNDHLKATEAHNTKHLNAKSFLEKFKGAGLIVFMANLIHKCGDGLVIGAAFSESPSLGISTALAALFHEIPHELGDYGLLFTIGFKNLQIILLNSIGSFSSLCVTLLIIGVSPDKNVRAWLTFNQFS